jgi:hypothetical protein
MEQGQANKPNEDPFFPLSSQEKAIFSFLRHCPAPLFSAGCDSLAFSLGKDFLIPTLQAVIPHFYLGKPLKIYLGKRHVTPELRTMEEALAHCRGMAKLYFRAPTDSGRKIYFLDSSSKHNPQELLNQGHIVIYLLTESQERPLLPHPRFYIFDDHLIEEDLLVLKDIRKLQKAFSTAKAPLNFQIQDFFANADQAVIEPCNPLDWHFCGPYFSLFNQAFLLGKELDSAFLPSLFRNADDPLLAYALGQKANPTAAYESLRSRYRIPTDPLTRMASYQHDLWELRSLLQEGYLKEKDSEYAPFSEQVARIFPETLREDETVRFNYYPLLFVPYLLAKSKN